MVLASALLHLVYFSTLLRGYRVSDLTVVYPVARGSAPLLSSVGAVLLLGEHLGAFGVAGVVGVTFGVFLVAGGPGLWAQAHEPLQRQRVRAGVLHGAITGALIAGYTVVQFESEGMQNYLKALKPDKFGDLIAMNALYRPGPMEYIPNFIAIFFQRSS